MLKKSALTFANAVLLILSTMTATGRDFGDDAAYGYQPADSRRLDQQQPRSRHFSHDSDANDQEGVVDVPPVPSVRHAEEIQQPVVVPVPDVSVPGGVSVPCDCHQQQAVQDGVYIQALPQAYSRHRSDSYGYGGTPLHPVDGQIAGDRFAGRRLHVSGSQRTRAAQSGYGRSRGRSVERFTGVPGMRVSEWPSPSTGMTLSEEQSWGANHGGFSHGPFSSVSYSTPLPPKRPAFNIPNHVW